MSVLAIDLGKTGCRAALTEPGTRHQTVAIEGARGLADRGGVEAAVLAITHAASRLVAPDDVDVLVVAAAGLGRTSPHSGVAHDRAEALLELLDDVFAYAHLVVCSDMTAAHAGALAGQPGVVLAAGTGTVALAIAASGAFSVVDGWGYLLGDEGSGYAIGRSGLSAALRSHDGRGGSPALASAATARYGELDSLPGVIHGNANPAAAIAAFAPDVLTAADRGDSYALRIRDRAVAELVSTAVTAAEAIHSDEGGEPEIATLGGLFENRGMRDAFTEALHASAPHLAIQAPKGSALDGAMLLANTGLPHEPLITRRLAARTT